MRHRTGARVGPVSFADQAPEATAPPASTSAAGVQTLATVTTAADSGRANETPASPAAEQAAFDEAVATSVDDVAAPVQSGITESDLEQAVPDAETCLTKVDAQNEKLQLSLDSLRQGLESVELVLSYFNKDLAKVKAEAQHATVEASKEQEACSAGDENVKALVALSGEPCLDNSVHAPDKRVNGSLTGLAHDQGDGQGDVLDGNSTGLAYDQSNGITRSSIGLVHGEVGDGATGSSTSLVHGQGDGFNISSTGPANGEEANVTAGGGLDIPAQIGNGSLERAVRNRLRIVSCISVTTILITASALKAAGYASRDIQWSITFEVMIATICLSPAFIGAIA
ncbi:hypothetical protein RRF57_008440 [Xylaria bambusicola]|uniref:Uncharacterized protein n=1 Tax=Xylaria bambusicola TaxID=326684 RepID=A0AAN7UVC8_9PEZI